MTKNNDYSQEQNSITEQLICITCPKHGEYRVTLMEYMGGLGCPDCMVENMSLVPVQKRTASDGTYAETLYQDDDGHLFAYRECDPVKKNEDGGINYRWKRLYPVSYSCDETIDGNSERRKND